MPQWKHARKGLIIGEIIHETDDAKWVKIKLENTVRGLNYSYSPGDIIICYKPSLTPLEEAEVPKES
jgi:hypothetical protein